MKKCAIKLVAFNGGHLGDCEGGIRDPNDARQRDPTTLDNVTQCELQWYENNYKALNLITTDLCRNVYDRVSHLKTAYDVVTPGFKAKPDAHRMYAQDQVVIHTVRM
jgi:hypothetical protein